MSEEKKGAKPLSPADQAAAKRTASMAAPQVIADAKLADAPPARVAEAIEAGAGKVTVLNWDLHLHTVDLGAAAGNAEAGEEFVQPRQMITLKGGRFRGATKHDIEPGETVVTRAEWEAICAHRTARHMVKPRGNHRPLLTLKEE